MDMNFELDNSIGEKPLLTEDFSQVNLVIMHLDVIRATADKRPA